MRRLFCQQIGEVGAVATLLPAEDKHLFKTLRANTEDVVELLDGKGMVAVAEVVGRDVIIRAVKAYAEPMPKLHLFIAPPKKQKMDQLLRQCAELGVAAIQPIITQRSVATPSKVSDRWELLLREGCKQSGNPFLPVIKSPIPFKQALQTIQELDAVSYFGSVKQQETKKTTEATNLVWMVGPEGGFSNAEEEAICKNGGLPLHIKGYALRVETAAICGLAILKTLSR